MGFEEYAISIIKNNRNLQKDLRRKYYQSNRTSSSGGNLELVPEDAETKARQEKADRLKYKTIRTQLIVLVICLIVVLVACLAFVNRY